MIRIISEKALQRSKTEKKKVKKERKMKKLLTLVTMVFTLICMALPAFAEETEVTPHHHADWTYS